MFPSSSSSAGMLRRMLIEATGIGSSNMKCRDEDPTAEGQRIVIADAMLSMSASPGPGSEHGYSQQRRTMANLTTDSDSDALHEMPLSPCQLDDDAEEDEDGDNVLDMIMDQDSSGILNEWFNKN
jgi:hypothetical protein